MRVILATLTAFAVSAEPSSSYDLGAQSGGIIGGLILRALNAVRDSKINPAIAKGMPDPLNIDVGKSGKASAGCIIPNPFGGCVCKASADYSVSLKEVKGLTRVQVTNFTSATVSADMKSITIGADIADPDVDIDKGGAHAGVSACDVSPSVSGSASTHVRLQKVRLTAAATGKVELLKRCIALDFTKVTISLDQVSVHDTSIDIDLGPIPGLEVGSLVDLVQNMAPDLTTEISHALQGPMSSALTNAVAKGDIPCIKIPIADSQAEDVQLV